MKTKKHVWVFFVSDNFCKYGDFYYSFPGPCVYSTRAEARRERNELVSVAGAVVGPIIKYVPEE